MFGLGLGEWLIILAAALLLFGPKFFAGLFRKIGQNAKSIGDEFKNGYDEGDKKGDSSEGGK
ncbi:twin-arginine translocase TatA/TatE family subunit [bacterium]|nr:twin-arginine translocase TatA/TatE family subunit [bacterium]